jgi:hypothetical protein
MPTHFVYVDPNRDELNQGDVLQRTDALSELLKEYFPYYQDHPDYRYFLVLTQTCDLVRRDGKTCGAPYISIAAVRPVKDVLLLEAEKLQEAPLRGTDVIGHGDRQTLAMFLESLMDNNKAGYFYLHTDHLLGISEPCCAFLQLAVSFRSQHYKACLDAKIAQLDAQFQAKLGWLIGNMYSRVATTEWDTEKPSERLGKVASSLIGKSFYNCAEEQIKAALDDLTADGSITTKTPQDIADYVKRKRLVPKHKQFKDRAAMTLKGMKIVEPVKKKAADLLWKDEALRKGIAELFAAEGPIEPDAKAKEVMKLILGRLRDLLTDENLPDRDKYISDLVSELMADNVLKSLIKP